MKEKGRVIISKRTGLCPSVKENALRADRKRQGAFLERQGAAPFYFALEETPQ
jgi:hypothetical protein